MRLHFAKYEKNENMHRSRSNFIYSAKPRCSFISWLSHFASQQPYSRSFFCSRRTEAGANVTFDAITLPQEIGEGKEREVETLFADAWRKLVLIRLPVEHC